MSCGHRHNLAWGQTLRIFCPKCHIFNGDTLASLIRFNQNFNPIILCWDVFHLSWIKWHLLKVPSEHKANLRIMKQHPKWMTTSQNQNNYHCFCYVTYASISVCPTSSTYLAPCTLVPHILLPSPSHNVAPNFYCCPLHPSNSLFHRQHIIDLHPPMLALQSATLLVQNHFVDFDQQHHILNFSFLVFWGHNNAPLDQFLESLGWLFNSKCTYDMLMPDVSKVLPYYCLLISLVSPSEPINCGQC